jgi:hypothetical protein
MSEANVVERRVRAPQLTESEMEYTMTTGELKVQNPEIVVRNLSITQENAPSFVLPDNRWSEPFRYKFSCICNGAYVEFEFEQVDRIEYAQYGWQQAVEKWLIPHLAKLPWNDGFGHIRPERKQRCN